jgi:hypothetical protein
VLRPITVGRLNDLLAKIRGKRFSHASASFAGLKAESRLGNG